MQLRIADLLLESVRGQREAANDPHPSISSLIEQLGARSFGIVLMLFGLPNLLPVPGLPMVCGVIIGVIAVQMVIGSQNLVLPRWIGDRRIQRNRLCRVVERSEPSLRWLENVMRPRWLFLTERQGQRAIGLMLVLLAVSLLAPIPFLGGIPPGFAVTLFGIALVERDGLFVIFGAIAGISALGIVGLLTYGILKAIFVVLA